MSKSKDTPSSPPALTELPLGDLLEEERRVRAAYEAAKKEVEAVADAELPLDEALPQMEHVVDEAGITWRQVFGRELVKIFTHPRNTPTLPAWVYRPWPEHERMHFWRAATKAALRDLLESDGYVPGLPRAERPAAIAAITARKTSLEARHTQLVEYIAEKLRELGQQHEPAYLEDVKKRKDDEVAEAKKSAAAAVREAVEAEAEGDKWHRAASGRGVVRSNYIHGRS